MKYSEYQTMHLIRRKQLVLIIFGKTGFKLDR